MSHSQTPGKTGLQWPWESWNLGLEYQQDPLSLISASLLTSLTPTPDYEQALGSISIPSLPERSGGKGSSPKLQFENPRERFRMHSLGHMPTCVASQSLARRVRTAPMQTARTKCKAAGFGSPEDEDMLFPEEVMMFRNKELNLQFYSL